METNSKSDIKAKEAYTKILAEEGFKDIKIISTPTDISASKNGTWNTNCKHQIIAAAPHVIAFVL